MNRDKKFCIIGCGVSGLSVAHLLLRQGREVTIITKHDPQKPSTDPAFSSAYPAASVIPHSINSENMETLFINSRDYFKHLHKEKFPGVSINEHFELFSRHTDFPAYSNWMENFTPFNNFKKKFHPNHPAIPILSGWKFNCFFADWSLYYPALLKTVMEAGADLQIREISANELTKLPFDVVINCSELGSLTLFEEENSLIYRGHILHVMQAPELINPNGQRVSYNFTPGADLYKSELGTPQDIYCYPRSDGWIWGGTRQKGTFDTVYHWKGEKNTDPVSVIDGEEIPAQIPTLHSTIIRHTFGVDAEKFPNRKVKVGYRYLRKPENGLRLETEEIGDKLFIHNYGHGGAGVTLSWGCAQKVVQMLEKATG